MPVYNQPVSKSAVRYEALMAAQGYYAETTPRGSASNATIMVSGTIYFNSVGLLAGDVVTNILTLCSLAGSGFSGIGMKAGLYSKAGVQLALTGDISVAHSSVAAKTNVLTTPYTVLTTDLYYVALIGIATTMPTLIRTPAGVATEAVFTGGFSPAYGYQTGQTDLTAPATIASTATTGIAFWSGIS